MTDKKALNPKDRFGMQLAKKRSSLSPSALNVANFIDTNRHAVLGLSALEIGLETGTSDATVIRAVQTLGFSGLRDLKDTLSNWLGHVESAVEKMANTSQNLGNEVTAAIDFTLESQRAALDALGSEENRENAEKAVQLISNARALGVFGIGASGVIAEYTARLFTRSGILSTAYNKTGIALAESLLHMQEGDVLLMLLHGRAHREATTTLAEAQRLNIPVIMILGRHDAPLRPQASASLVLPRFKADNVALHAQSVFAVEALHLGVSMLNTERSIDSLERLLTMRKNIRPFSR
jgi:DNA-binding MurR/RpiR family transcriptional regulator